MHLNNAFYLYLITVVGVFGVVTGNTETVSVMVGESVTLQTDSGAITGNNHILWLFGSDSPGIRIAEVIKWSYMLSIYVCHKERFRDQLQLDHQTGSLTITNISAEHAGLYKLTIMNNKKTSHKRFSVKVYDSLPIPLITGGHSHNSSASERSSGSKCVLLCSVKNVSWATLSLYKGNDLLSNISGSDLSTILSLSLEMEYDDQHTYSCVVNNFFSNHTTNINITDLCQPHSEVSLLSYLVLLVLIPLAVIVIVWILCIYRKRGKARDQADENC